MVGPFRHCQQLAGLPEFAADKAEALKAGKEPFPGHLVTVVLKEGEPGTSFAPFCPGNEQDRQKLLAK